MDCLKEAESCGNVMTSDDKSLIWEAYLQLLCGPVGSK